MYNKLCIVLPCCLYISHIFPTYIYPYRGLYIRNFIFDDIVWRFLEETKGQGQIVSLGAGFDTRYFRLKASKSFRGLYLEVSRHNGCKMYFNVVFFKLYF